MYAKLTFLVQTNRDNPQSTTGCRLVTQRTVTTLAGYKLLLIVKARTPRIENLHAILQAFSVDLSSCDVPRVRQ